MSFGKFIVELIHEMYSGFKIHSSSLDILNFLLNHFCKKIYSGSLIFFQFSQENIKLELKHLIGSIELNVTQDLKKRMKEEIDIYLIGKSKFSLSVKIIESILSSFNYKILISKDYVSCMCIIIEYLTAELIENSITACKLRKSVVISDKDIGNGIDGDTDELNVIFNDVMLIKNICP